MDAGYKHNVDYALLVAVDRARVSGHILRAVSERPWIIESPVRPDSGAEALEAFERVMMMLVASLPARPPARAAEPMPMLTVQQTAALLGMSRMTVIRKADAGELPCVAVSRGTRQKMRRFPRAAIEDLAADGVAECRSN